MTWQTGLESLQEEAGENHPEDIADNDSDEDDDGEYSTVYSMTCNS
jgi:hypothetical protein